MAGEGAVALAADIAAHAGVDLHVLLERALRLETLPAQQTEDGHVGACGQQGGESLRRVQHKATVASAGLEREPGARVRLCLCPPAQGRTRRRTRPRSVDAALSLWLRGWTRSTYLAPLRHLKSSGRERQSNPSPRQTCVGSRVGCCVKGRALRGHLSEGLFGGWGRRWEVGVVFGVGDRTHEDSACQPGVKWSEFKVPSPEGRLYPLTSQMR